jgi:hypothetical protein
MDSLENEWQLTGSEGGLKSAARHGMLFERIQRAEAEVSRLESRLESKERELNELQMALAYSAARQYAAEHRLERELQSVGPSNLAAEPARCQTGTNNPSWSDGRRDPEGGVIIYLPFVTEVLSTLFDAMYAFWKDYDPEHPPKSSAVARAIDERLHLTAQPNGEASRSGQAYASAIRPDCIKEADRRHHVGRRT